MKSTFSVIFFLRRDRKKSDGTCQIMCRITIDGEDTHFNTKLHIQESRWIMTKRKKTNIDVNAPLLDIPKIILDKYKGQHPDG